MDETDTLQDILKRMQGAEETLRAERAHCYADELLCDALRVLAAPQDRALVEQIINVYDNIPKWYH